MAAETTAVSAHLSPVGRPDAGPAGTLVGKLFAEHGRLILGLCRLLLRDAVEAEDAAQQVFLSAYRSLLGGAVPRDAAAWLTAIARNECRARARKRMREPLTLTEVPSDFPDPLASAISRADVDAIWVALAELPRRQQRALLLREVGGLSYGELGAALRVSRPAVESLLFRARQHVRNAVARANAALVPIALRDQLAGLIPSSPAKIAAVTAGLGLTAAGVVAVPDHHRRAPLTHAHATVAQTRADSRHVTRSSVPVVASVQRDHTSGDPASTGERDDDTVRAADRKGPQHDRAQSEESEAAPPTIVEPQETEALLPAPTSEDHGGTSGPELSASSDGSDGSGGSVGSNTVDGSSGSDGSSSSDDGH